MSVPNMFADFDFADANTSLDSIMSWLNPFDLDPHDEVYWNSCSGGSSTETSNQSSPSLSSSQSLINIDNIYPEMLSPDQSLQRQSVSPQSARQSVSSSPDDTASKRIANRVERRRLQNREAQKNFRKRKEVQLQAALEELVIMKNEQQFLKDENQNLEAIIVQLKEQLKLWQANRSLPTGISSPLFESF